MASIEFLSKFKVDLEFKNPNYAQKYDFTEITDFFQNACMNCFYLLQRQITLRIVGYQFSSRLTAILNLCLIFFEMYVIKYFVIFFRLLYSPWDVDKLQRRAKDRCRDICRWRRWAILAKGEPHEPFDESFYLYKIYDYIHYRVSWSQIKQ